MLATEWNEFRHPDWAELKGLLKAPILIDGRNIFAPDQVKAAGFQYFGIGRS